MNNAYNCVCGNLHEWNSVHAIEYLARATDSSTNTDKYWRIVEVETTCNSPVVLVHYGRWTGGWRNRGSWQITNRTAAMKKLDQKLARGYDAFSTGGWESLPLSQQGSPSEDTQDGVMLLKEAGLLQGSAQQAQPSTPVEAPKSTTVVTDPVEVLMQRSNTLATRLATSSELTAELAIERAELLAELASTQARLDRIESTLEMATALLTSKR